jgi:hypothetical protein
MTPLVPGTLNPFFSNSPFHGVKYVGGDAAVGYRLTSHSSGFWCGKTKQTYAIPRLWFTGQ